MQTIWKLHPVDKFVQLPNELFENPNLSMKAKGILGYLLSRPPDWRANQTDIANRCTEGRDAIRTGLHELEAHGYITCHLGRDEDGRFLGYVYNVYADPVDPEQRTNPEDRTFERQDTDMGKSDVGSSDVGLSNTTKKDSTKKDSTKKHHGANAHDSGKIPTGEKASPKQTTIPGMDVEPEEEKTDGRAWFLTLAEVCQVDLSLASKASKMQVGQSAKILKEAGKTPEEIRAFGDWWFKEDWRGKQGQPPRPAQVRDEWGTFEGYGKKKNMSGGRHVGPRMGKSLR